MKRFLKFTSAALMCLILVSLFLSTLTVYAATSKSENTDNENIYYTDLFYAYPYYLQNDAYFQSYSKDIANLYGTIFDQYKNSDLVIRTGLDKALSSITSISELSSFITDALGLTEVSLDQALDAANDEFVLNLLTDTPISNTYNAFGKTAHMTSQFNALIKFFNDLKLQSNSGFVYTVEYYVQSAFDFLWDSGCLNFFSDETLSQLWMELNDKDFSLNSCFSVAKTEIEIAQAITSCLFLEHSKLEIVDEIISTQTENTILKQGMSRLKKEMRGSVVTNFIEQYLSKKVADKIFSAIDKFALTLIDANGWKTVLKVAKEALNIIAPAPSYEEVIKWRVLICYSNDLATAIKKQAASFSEGPFLSDQIFKYEHLFTAYDIVNKSALTMTEKIYNMLDPYEEVYSFLKESEQAGIKAIIVKESGIALPTPIPTNLSMDELRTLLTFGSLPDGTLFDFGKTINFYNGTKTIKIQINANIIASLLRDCKNGTLLQDFKDKYETKNLYSDHIDSVEKSILNTPKSARKLLEKAI